MRTNQSDAELEAEIDVAVLRFRTAPTIPARRAAWSELQTLINQRSPEQVAWMEESRGLTK